MIGHLSFLSMLFLLVGGHYLGDFGLQSDSVAQMKNPSHERGRGVWPHVLLGHGMIHGFFVAVITGYTWLGVMEVIIHCYTDYQKCQGNFTFTQDQSIHLVCKFMWAVCAVLYI